MQLLQPLAVQHVGLATRHVLDASGVHQHHLEVPLFQHPEQGYPVHAGGLHDHGLHTALRQPIGQTIQVRREGLKLLHRLLRPVGRNRHEMAGGAYGHARRVQVQLGQPRRLCATLASAHHSLHDYRVGGSPEGVTDNVQSPERDRLWWGVTNDAVARLPDHATDRAIRTSVLSVLVRTTRLAMSIHSGRAHQLVASARAGYGHNSATH